MKFKALFLGLLMAVVTSPVFAAGQPYSDGAFAAAQAANKMIVVDVFKRGCPTCAAQQPALQEAQRRFPNAVFFEVDYNNDRASVNKFRAVRQSTLIVYRGTQERARLVAETNQNRILSEFAKGAQ